MVFCGYCWQERKNGGYKVICIPRSEFDKSCRLHDIERYIALDVNFLKRYPTSYALPNEIYGYAAGCGLRSRQLEEVNEMNVRADLEFIQMDMTQLAESLRSQGNEWISLYAQRLHEIARPNMAAVQNKLDRLNDELIADIDDLDELKAVLQVTLCLLACLHSCHLICAVVTDRAGLLPWPQPQPAVTDCGL